MRKYSKTARSVCFDNAIIDASDKYLTKLRMRHISITFSDLVRVSLSKYLKEKLDDEL
jgi:translation initiation factor IF-1